MIQLNKYKKVCYLTDAEKSKINDFFHQMFEVDKMTNISVYIDNNGRVICEIEGIEKESLRAIGSRVRHDIEELI